MAVIINIFLEGKKGDKTENTGEEAEPMEVAPNDATSQE